MASGATPDGYDRPVSLQGASVYIPYGVESNAENRTTYRWALIDYPIYC